MLLTGPVQHCSGDDGETPPVGLCLAGLKGAAAIGNLLFAAIEGAGPWLGRPALMPFSAVTVPILGSLAVLDVLAGWRGQDRGEGKSCTQLEQPIDPSAPGMVGERADQNVDGRHVRTPQIDMAPWL